MSAALPHHPNRERLSGHAKQLRDLVRGGVTGGIDLVRANHPRPAPALDVIESFRLSDAQLTLARHYGFASWPRMMAHVDMVNGLTRSPHELPTPPATVSGGVDAFLVLACLNFGNDAAERVREAERFLAATPSLAMSSISAMAACSRAKELDEALSADPAAASRADGPFGWPPLLWLVYSRIGGGDPVATMQVLLRHGADPNAGYLWDGNFPPFTALTGVFGRGEQGASMHRLWRPLAELLLAAGADSNDGQAVYNLSLGEYATDDVEPLALLLDAGLGAVSRGPWYRRFRDHLTPEPLLLHDLLHHAATHGLLERCRLLLAHGVNPDVSGAHPVFRGTTPLQSAIMSGNPDAVIALAAAGATGATVSAEDRFAGALLADDHDGVALTAADDPTIVSRTRERWPGLVSRAAGLGRPDVVVTLIGHGFDVNHRSRTTALHDAAGRGDRAMVDVLLAHGADVTITDREHGGTPAGWAHHGGHVALAAFLAEREAKPIQ